jgi:hypothetical protein
MDLNTCRISATRADQARLTTGRLFQRPPARVIRIAAASSSAQAAAAPPTFDLACPICQTTVFSLRQSAGRPAGDCTCRRCGRAFPLSDTYVDLTLGSGTSAPPPGSLASSAAGTSSSSPTKQAYQQKSWGGQEIFRSPLVALAYERGWRQGFVWAGFPGADREFVMATDRLRPAEGGTLVDMSCGSGLFTRRFLASGRFSKVIAADFSESMLRQARAYLDQEGKALALERCVLVRADVGRLPMATGSIDVVHAGAAIHCWPDPQVSNNRCIPFFIPFFIIDYQLLL